MTDEHPSQPEFPQFPHPERRSLDPRIDTIAAQVGLTDHRVANMEHTMTLMQTSLADLSKAMINIARVEERLAASHDQLTRMDQRLATVEAASVVSRGSAEGVAERSRWLERAFWVVMVAATSYLIGELGAHAA
jgi:hypothetical protein